MRNSKALSIVSNLGIKKIILLFLILYGFQPPASSQDQKHKKIDSLLIALSTSAEDTGKVTLLNILSSEFRYADSDTALYFINQAIALATKLNDEMGIANSKMRRGGTYADMGRFNDGLKSANEALVLYKKLFLKATDEDKIKIKRSLGNVYNVLGHNSISQGNYPEGLKYSFLALKEREEIGNKRGVADTQYNIGNIYLSQSNFPAALKQYFISLKLYEELGRKSDVASTYNTIGWVYMEQGNYPEALKYCNTALKLAGETNDGYLFGEVYGNLGVVNEKMGNFKDAQENNFAALKIYEETGINEQIPGIYNNITSVYMKQKNYKSAFEYLDKAFSYSKKIGKLETIRQSYENAALLDSMRGNYKSAYRHYKLFIQYRDSVVNDENKKQLVQQQMQYDFDKKEAATQAQQDIKDAVALKELQKQKLVRNGFIGGFGVVALFAGVFFTQRNKIKKGKKRSDELLLNILPEEVAEELKAKGSADAKQFDEVTVMFTDFKGFTRISEKLSPSDLVAEIHFCFKTFDNIITRHNIEKIKTIGDSYMCAGGLPVTNKTNAADVVSAALEIQQFMQQHLQQRKKENKEPFEIRIGVHTGPVVAGIVGVKKFAYDIWGDTVNIASRMESSGEAGKVNISGTTYKLVKDKFKCIHRGKVEAKNKGVIDMYFVES